MTMLRRLARVALIGVCLGALGASARGIEMLGIEMLGTEARAARVCDGPGINHRPESFASDEILSVLAYNIYLLPTHVRSIPSFGEKFATAQEERAAIIPSFVAPYDVVIFSEAYDDDAREILMAGLRANGFVHSTHILGSAYSTAPIRRKNRIYRQPKPIHACAGPSSDRSCDDPAAIENFAAAGEGDIGIRIQDGGVIIVSRHPITEARELVYEACAGLDCNASKGFVYARIEKGSSPYHVIGTHVQFGWGAEQRAVRARQLREIWDFVANKSGIPFAEPVIIGGDLNTFPSDLPRLLSGHGLGVRAPRLLGHRYTRETRNDWVSRGNGYVDYILTKKWWKAPSYSSNCPMIFRTLFDYEDETVFSSYRGEDICDLSDHYAVWGYFDYRASVTEGPDCPVPEFPEG